MTCPHPDCEQTGTAHVERLDLDDVIRTYYYCRRHFDAIFRAYDFREIHVEVAE